MELILRLYIAVRLFLLCVHNPLLLTQSQHERSVGDHGGGRGGHIYGLATVLVLCERQGPHRPSSSSRHTERETAILLLFRAVCWKKSEELNVTSFFLQIYLFFFCSVNKFLRPSEGLKSMCLVVM